MAYSSNHEHIRKEFEQRVLSQMEERLVELLDVESICKGLCDKCIFDSTDSDAVQGTKKDQVKFFIGRLLARDPSSYSVFLDLLRKSDRESHSWQESLTVLAAVQMTMENLYQRHQWICRKVNYIFELQTEVFKQ